MIDTIDAFWKGEIYALRAKACSYETSSET